MSHLADTVKIPDAQTAEELLGWLTDSFRYVQTYDGIIILDQDDIATLISACASFEENRARNEGQPAAERLRKEAD